MDLYLEHFPIEDYCHAIGYAGPLQPTLPVITALVRSQLMNIPFENLDVLAGNTVSMAAQSMLDKLLYSARGGYCYELNGLFAMVLGHMQIPHSLLLARPMFYPAKRPRTHMVIVLYLAQKLYLVDLGFGSYGPRAPIPLEQLDEIIEQDNEQFVLSSPSEGEFVLSALVDGDWKKQYGFNLTPQEWIDFVPANYFNSNHPESIFTQKPLILLHTPQGRAILFGDQLKIIDGQNVITTTVADSELVGVLEETFGIELDNGQRTDRE